MRAWRQTHRLAGLARKKDSVRSIANVAKRRGHIVSEPCRICGAAAEMHHPDYSQPLLVQWLCRPHHLQLHRETKEDLAMAS
jgi:hypothetical protein